MRIPRFARRERAAFSASILFIVILAAPSARSGSAQPLKTELILLGTGTPVPDPDAWGPASAVVVGDRLFLIDAGAGVTRRLAASGFPRVKSVAALFLTHLHSDHTLGYPDLIFSTWIMGRREPLIVYGPPGLKRLTDRLIDAWADDIDVRVKGLERERRDWLNVDVREIAAGTIYERRGVKVTAVGVPHGEWQSFAFRFDTPSRSITFSGDTAPNRGLEDLAKGTDVLVHEVYNSSRVAPEQRPGGEHWPEYLKTYHTSDTELGRLAARVKPGLLVLVHVLRLGGTDAEILSHIRSSGYAGRVVIGKDLDRY